MINEKFHATLSDVVWRFYVYGQYGRDAKKALNALAKRAAGQATEFYREAFEADVRLLKATIEAVESAPKRPKPGQLFSEYSDVNAEFVIETLHAQFPSQDDEGLKRYFGMVVYWYYLR